MTGRRVDSSASTDEKQSFSFQLAHVGNSVKRACDRLIRAPYQARSARTAVGTASAFARKAASAA